MTITKEFLVNTLLDKRICTTHVEAKALVSLFFDGMADALINNEQVKLTGFGNFNLRDKSPRPARNPKTGEPVTIAARRVVTFSAGPKLKQRLDNAHQGDTRGE